MEKCSCEKIIGVGCDVVNCKYHVKDNNCCAGSIKVESHNAVHKGETFCGTFSPKSSI